jgi:hypothetical protein
VGLKCLGKANPRSQASNTLSSHSLLGKSTLEKRNSRMYTTVFSHLPCILEFLQLYFELVGIRILEDMLNLNLNFMANIKTILLLFKLSIPKNMRKGVKGVYSVCVEDTAPLAGGI